MPPTLGQRIKLIEETHDRLESHLDRLKREIEIILSEISLDIPEQPE